MTQSKQRSALVLAVALFSLVPGLTLLAQIPEPASDEVTLIGQLSVDEEGGYVLIEEESGDAILLESSNENLAKHVGAEVRVHGVWAMDATGTKYFEVARVEDRTR